MSEEERVVESQRREDTLAHGDLERLARHDFDDATREHEAATAVGPKLAGSGELWEAGEAGDAAGEGVVAHAKVVIVVAEEAALVTQELAQGDGAAGALVGEPEIGQ